MAKQASRSITVLTAHVDPAEVLADIALLTKVLQVLEAHPHLLSSADRERLQELADLVTVGELTPVLAQRRAKRHVQHEDA